MNQRPPQGFDVSEVHESELTADERRAFGLPACTTGNADLVPATRDQSVIDAEQVNLRG